MWFIWLFVYKYINRPRETERERERESEHAIKLYTDLIVVIIRNQSKFQISFQSFDETDRLKKQNERFECELAFFKICNFLDILKFCKY